MSGDALHAVAESGRIHAIHDAVGRELLNRSALARCLAPLLVALNWSGAPRQLRAEMPVDIEVLDTDAFSRLLSRLGYCIQSRRWKDWPGGLEALPVGSVLLSGQQAQVYLGRSAARDWWHDGMGISANCAELEGSSLLLITRDYTHRTIDKPQTAWLNRLLFTARHELGGILFISLVANLLALVISLFTMFVYNTVIPSGATDTLWAMTAGVALAIVGAWGLRCARVTLVSRLTAWAGLRINDAAFAKTLGLPLDVSARLGRENNLIRLRTLESVRQWFGGGGAVSVDYPFILVFLAVIGALGGWIVVVPLIGLLLFALLSWPLSLLLNARSVAASQVSRQLTELTGTITNHLRSLRGVEGLALWRRQVAELVAQSVACNRDYAVANGLAQTVGQALGMLTVLATMGAGIALVLAKEMSTGGLIATMMLIWRVTTPAQQFFASQVRIKQLVDSARQLERLLGSAGESSNPHQALSSTQLQADIEADRLYYRHSAQQEPALSGVSFKVEAGQMLAVVGPNGAGKTTLLELLAGVRSPQNGRVRIANRDIRQFDPSDYRTWHGYLAQRPPCLPLTVRQTLTMKSPAHGDEELQTALARVAGSQWWQLMGASSASAGLDLKLDPWRQDRAAMRSRFLVQLAGALLGNPPLLLLDDPLCDRDPLLDTFLSKLLDELRGKTTVVIATHRPDLIQRADLIAVLHEGALAHFGPVAAPDAQARPA